MSPLFSIIVPVHNTEPYLRECLDSVLSQTFTDWEALCVDDGSTDGSGAILDECTRRDSRIRAIHQDNAGVSAARNAALDIAKGEWICFLDSDDKVECHWLEDIAAGAQKHPEVDWIRTSYRDWIEGKEPQPWPEDFPLRQEPGVHENVREVVWNQMACAGFIVLGVYRRIVVDDLRFDTSIAYGEDACFSADYMHRSKRLLTIPNDSYRYRLRADSATHVTKTVADMAAALGNIMRKWETIPGETGAFTPSIVRHLGRCRRDMSRNDNRMWVEFLRRAWRKRFFALRRIPKMRTRLRWMLYLLSANPVFLFNPAGLRWLFPYRWNERCEQRATCLQRHVKRAMRTW